SFGFLLQRTEVAALVAARVDERLDAAELSARVASVQGEGGAAPAALRARHGEVPRDLAAGLGVGLVELREGEPEDEVRDLVRRLVLEPAGLLVEIVPAGVLLGRVPERLAVVVAELARVGGHHLEPVSALLEELSDGLGLA